MVFSPDKDMPTVWALGTTAEALLGPDWHRVRARHFGETLPEGPASVVLLPISPDRVVAAIERSDVCAVPAAAVVGEAMTSFVLADAFLEKFGGDSVEEIQRHYDATREAIRRRFAVPSA